MAWPELTNPDWLQGARWFIVILVAAVAAIVDLRRRRIPNAITFPLFVIGVVTSGLLNGLEGIGHSLLGALIAGGPFVILWLIGGGGAGDAKMMLAIGAWLVPNDALAALICVALIGGVVSIIHAVADRGIRSTLARLSGLIGSVVYIVKGPGRFTDRREVLPKLNAREGVPYGVAICLGLCAAVFVAAAEVKPW